MTEDRDVPTAGAGVVQETQCGPTPIEELVRLVTLAGGGAAGRGPAAQDSAIAERLVDEAVLVRLLGHHPYLGINLRRLLDLALGGRAWPETPANPLAGLCRLLVAGRLPLSRAALVGRVRDQMGAPLPLGSGRREEEIHLFLDLVAVLVTPHGVVGEAAMAEALAARYARRLEQEGGVTDRLVIQGIVETLPNLFSRLHFLAAVAASGLGRRAIDDIEVLVHGLAHNQALIESAMFHPFDPEALAQALDDAVAGFDRTTVPTPVKARVRARIAGLVDAFVMRGNFLGLIERAEPSVMLRREKLAAVIAAGLVTEFGGRSLVEQHMARITARAGGNADTAAVQQAPPPVGPAWDTRLRSRFGRTRCPYCFEPKSGGFMCQVCGYDEDEGARPGVHLPAGTVLQGRYVIGRLLGQGGFGATYLGWDERLQVKVAVKEYFPVSLAGRVTGTGALEPYVEHQEVTFRDGIVKFIAEARTLARLRHVREIVEVFDHFETNGTAYMVMELLLGRTLQRHLLEEGGSIDYRRALGLLLPIAKAVHAVHGLGLVHRDISPDNIFLVDHGEAKLLDFGAARHYVGGAIGALEVILKRGYAPPEQYRVDGDQGPWTDVYALCATLYCAITGRPPPDASGRGDDDTLIRPSRLGIALPAALEEALLVGLALRRQDRPQDMKTWLHGLNRALS